MPNPNFQPGLTREELRDIGLRRDPAEIITLLWEIKRLRAIVWRADQLQRSLPATMGGGAGMVLAEFRADLAGEPVTEGR